MVLCTCEAGENDQLLRPPLSASQSGTLTRSFDQSTLASSRYFPGSQKDSSKFLSKGQTVDTYYASSFRATRSTADLTTAASSYSLVSADHDYWTQGEDTQTINTIESYDDHDDYSADGITQDTIYTRETLDPIRETREAQEEDTLLLDAESRESFASVDSWDRPGAIEGCCQNLCFSEPSFDRELYVRNLKSVSRLPRRGRSPPISFDTEDAINGSRDVSAASSKDHDTVDLDKNTVHGRDTDAHVFYDAAVNDKVDATQKLPIRSGEPDNLTLPTITPAKRRRTTTLIGKRLKKSISSNFRRPLGRSKRRTSSREDPPASSDNPTASLATAPTTTLVKDHKRISPLVNVSPESTISRDKEPGMEVIIESEATPTESVRDECTDGEEEKQDATVSDLPLETLLQGRDGVVRSLSISSAPLEAFEVGPEGSVQRIDKGSQVTHMVGMVAPAAEPNSSVLTAVVMKDDLSVTSSSRTQSSTVSKDNGTAPSTSCSENDAVECRDDDFVCTENALTTSTSLQSSVSPSMSSTVQYGAIENASQDCISSRELQCLNGVRESGSTLSAPLEAFEVNPGGSIQRFEKNNRGTPETLTTVHPFEEHTLPDSKEPPSDIVGGVCSSLPSSSTSYHQEDVSETVLTEKLSKGLALGKAFRRSVSFAGGIIRHKSSKSKRYETKACASVDHIESSGALSDNNAAIEIDRDGLACITKAASKRELLPNPSDSNATSSSALSCKASREAIPVRSCGLSKSEPASVVDAVRIASTVSAPLEELEVENGGTIERFDNSAGNEGHALSLVDRPEMQQVLYSDASPAHAAVGGDAEEKLSKGVPIVEAFRRSISRVGIVPRTSLQSNKEKSSGSVDNTETPSVANADSNCVTEVDRDDMKEAVTTDMVQEFDFLATSADSSGFSFQTTRSTVAKPVSTLSQNSMPTESDTRPTAVTVGSTSTVSAPVEAFEVDPEGSIQQCNETGGNVGHDLIVADHSKAGSSRGVQGDTTEKLPKGISFGKAVRRSLSIARGNISYKSTKDSRSFPSGSVDCASASSIPSDSKAGLMENPLPELELSIGPTDSNLKSSSAANLNKTNSMMIDQVQESIPPESELARVVDTKKTRSTVSAPLEAVEVDLEGSIQRYSTGTDGMIRGTASLDSFLDVTTTAEGKTMEKLSKGVSFGKAFRRSMSIAGGIVPLMSSKENRQRSLTSHTHDKISCIADEGGQTTAIELIAFPAKPSSTVDLPLTSVDGDDGPVISRLHLPTIRPNVTKAVELGDVTEGEIGSDPTVYQLPSVATGEPKVCDEKDHMNSSNMSSSMHEMIQAGPSDRSMTLSGEDGTTEASPCVDTTAAHGDETKRPTDSLSRNIQECEASSVPKPLPKSSSSDSRQESNDNSAQAVGSNRKSDQISMNNASENSIVKNSTSASCISDYSLQPIENDLEYRICATPYLGILSNAPIDKRNKSGAAPSESDAFNREDGSPSSADDLLVHQILEAREDSEIKPTDTADVKAANIGPKGKGNFERHGVTPAQSTKAKMRKRFSKAISRSLLLSPWTKNLEPTASKDSTSTPKKDDTSRTVKRTGTQTSLDDDSGSTGPSSFNAKVASSTEDIEVPLECEYEHNSKAAELGMKMASDDTVQKPMSKRKTSKSSKRKAGFGTKAIGRAIGVVLMKKKTESRSSESLKTMHATFCPLDDTGALKPLNHDAFDVVCISTDEKQEDSFTRQVTKEAGPLSKSEGINATKIDPTIVTSSIDSDSSSNGLELQSISANDKSPGALPALREKSAAVPNEKSMKNDATPKPGSFHADIDSRYSNGDMSTAAEKLSEPTIRQQIVYPPSDMANAKEDIDVEKKETKGKEPINPPSVSKGPPEDTIPLPEDSERNDIETSLVLFKKRLRTRVSSKILEPPPQVNEINEPNSSERHAGRKRIMSNTVSRTANGLLGLRFGTVRAQKTSRRAKQDSSPAPVLSSQNKLGTPREENRHSEANASGKRNNEASNRNAATDPSDFQKEPDLSILIDETVNATKEVPRTQSKSDHRAKAVQKPSTPVLGPKTTKRSNERNEKTGKDSASKEKVKAAKEVPKAQSKPNRRFSTPVLSSKTTKRSNERNTETLKGSSGKGDIKITKEVPKAVNKASTPLSSSKTTKRLDERNGETKKASIKKEKTAKEVPSSKRDSNRLTEVAIKASTPVSRSKTTKRPDERNSETKKASIKKEKTDKEVPSSKRDSDRLTEAAMKPSTPVSSSKTTKRPDGKYSETKKASIKKEKTDKEVPSSKRDSNRLTEAAIKPSMPVSSSKTRKRPDERNGETTKTSTRKEITMEAPGAERDLDCLTKAVNKPLTPVSSSKTTKRPHERNSETKKSSTRKAKTTKEAPKAQRDSNRRAKSVNKPSTPVSSSKITMRSNHERNGETNKAGSKKKVRQTGVLSTSANKMVSENESSRNRVDKPVKETLLFHHLPDPESAPEQEGKETPIAPKAKAKTRDEKNEKPPRRRDRMELQETRDKPDEKPQLSSTSTRVAKKKEAKQNKRQLRARKSKEKKKKGQDESGVVILYSHGNKSSQIRQRRAKRKESKITASKLSDSKLHTIQSLVSAESDFF